MSERAISLMCTKSSPLPSLYPHHQHHRIMIHVDEYTGIKITNTNTFTPHHHVCIIASENHRHQSHQKYHHDLSWNVSFEGDALFTKELWSTCCWFDRRENRNKSENGSEVMVISFKLAMKPSNWWCEIFVLVTKYLNWRLNLWWWRDGIFKLVMEYSNIWFDIRLGHGIFEYVTKNFSPETSRKRKVWPSLTTSYLCFVTEVIIKNKHNDGHHDYQ